jgi:ketosteroid isomerase-like protein
MGNRPGARVIVLLALATLACARNPAPAPIPAGDAAEIRAARADQNAAIAAHDYDRVASYWTEDVVITAGRGTVLRGRSAYRAAFASDSGFIYHRETTAIDLSTAWPLAWEEGTWTGSSTAGGAPLLSGRYSAQWIKVSGRWLIRSELFVALTCSGAMCPAVPAARGR